MTNCLTFIGTGSIQQFVYQSNRLKENVGASWLVSQALEYWNAPGLWRPIFVGGGNAAVIFEPGHGKSALEIARSQVTVWSEKMLEVAPGLRVLAAHHEYQPGELAGAFKVVREKLRAVENRAPSGAPLGSLPICRQCNSTGLAAAEYTDREWMSQESAKKRSVVESATTHLRRTYASQLSTFSDFPVQIDDLGLMEGERYMAVVHADGNGIGKLFEPAKENATDEDVEKQFKDLSAELTDISKAAFERVLERVNTAVSNLKEEEVVQIAEFFPLRPIVWGGDDLTFVCHGRLGLDLAVAYLKAFEEESKAKNLSLTACAGVAIIPSKFPFARAYHLAGQLCASAKRERIKRDSSWIDFEIVREGALPDLGGFRSANYYPKVQETLLMRPYLVADGHARSWSRFTKRWRKFHKEVPRSKAKSLMNDLALGRRKDAIGFLESRGHTDLESPWIDMNESGQSKVRIREPLFDPLDALDFYFPLD